MINKIEQTRRELIKKGKKIINLSSGNPGEFGILFPQNILKAGYSKFLNNLSYKPDPKGDISARKAITKFYSKRNFKINSDQIVLTSGTSESYFHLFKLLCAPGDEVLFPKPSYPLFEEIARLAEVKCSFYRLAEEAGWQIDLDHLKSKIKHGTKAIVLISPSNPTGAVLSKKTLEEVIKIAAENNLAIISDEVFSEFIFDQKEFPHVAQLHQKMLLNMKAEFSNQKTKNGLNNLQIYTLSGISKAYALPGLKLAWIITTCPTANILEEKVDNLERHADAFLACNQITQNLLPDIINKGNNFIIKYKKNLERNRNLAMNILGDCPNISFHKPEGGMYLFAKIRGLGKLSDEDFVVKLMQETAIFAHPGYFYDYDEDLYILISFLMPQSKLKTNLEKLVKFIKRI